MYHIVVSNQTKAPPLFQVIPFLPLPCHTVAYLISIKALYNALHCGFEPDEALPSHPCSVHRPQPYAAAA